jgi:MarR family transcriptional regulator, 2-MHQ and catechol-resistance regulon repressor
MSVMPDRLEDPRLTLVGLLAEVFTGMEAEGATQLAEHGLANAEFEVLIRLARSPNRRLRMTHLAAQTSLTTSGITRVVDRLVGRGLVTRQACPQDRRCTYAVITAAGLDRMEAVLPGHLDVVDRWLVAPLDDGQLQALESALRTVRDAGRPEATAGADEPAAARTG